MTTPSTRFHVRAILPRATMLMPAAHRRGQTVCAAIRADLRRSGIQPLPLRASAVVTPVLARWEDARGWRLAVEVAVAKEDICYYHRTRPTFIYDSLGTRAIIAAALVKLGLALEVDEYRGLFDFVWRIHLGVGRRPDPDSYAIPEAP